MTLSDIHPTSETWTRCTAGMRWFAAYRIDVHTGQFVAVLSRWTDAIADPRQTLLRPQPTKEQAVWAAERILQQLGYQMEGCTVSEKLIVFFHDANDRYGLEDGLVLHAQGEHFEAIVDRHEGFAARYPIQETVPGGARLMVWEGERQRDCQWDADDDPYFAGVWRPATAIDLIDADLLGGLE